MTSTQGSRILLRHLRRALRPRVVVETGVGSGVTTSFMLQALAANDEGHLWSIDLPPIGAEQFAVALSRSLYAAGPCYAAAPATCTEASH